MSKIAVIQTGGKQYTIKEGDKIVVEKLNANVGDEIELNTLLTSEDDGSNLNLGTPELDTKVKAKVLEHKRAKKIRVVKFKNKTRQHKVRGHRQEQSVLEITAI